MISFCDFKKKIFQYCLPQHFTQTHTECRKMVILYCWYQKVKKRLHVPALITLWVAIPVFEIAMSVFSTDIISGVCVPWGVYSSVAMAKSMSFAVFLVGYLLPLAMMIFCYSRIVYTLLFKVTQHRYDLLLIGLLSNIIFT